MIVKHISIRNFRAIREFEYSCGQGMNVIIGVNGAGKSSFLSAVRILMSWFVARMKNPKGRGIVLTDDDITIGENYCSLSISFYNNASWTLSKIRTYGKASEDYTKSNFEQINGFISFIRDNSFRSMPIMAYYGVNRSVLEVPLRLNKKHKLSPLDVYNDTLDSGANYRSFFEWFREREDLENEQIRDNHQYRDKQLSAVRKAIETVFQGYGNFKVRRNPRAFVLEKGSLSFDFKQLSDGEKCYITLIGDLAKKLAMANPEIDNPLSDGLGVVLIDEVDLHLHPDWQSDILPNLRKVFPKCQFFVTTHSPFVVSDVDSFGKNDTFVRLENGIPDVIDENTYGMSVEDILVEYFKVKTLRNKDIMERQQRVWGFLRRGDVESEDYHNEKAELASKLNKTDLEFVRILAEEKKIKRGRDEKNQ